MFDLLLAELTVEHEVTGFGFGWFAKELGGDLGFAKVIAVAHLYV